MRHHPSSSIFLLLPSTPHMTLYSSSMADSNRGRYIPLPTRARHGDAEWQNAYEDIHKNLVNAVQKVEYEYSKAKLSSHDSVYIGVTGLAFMQYTLASRIPPHVLSASEDVLDPKSLHRKADYNLYSVIHQNRIPSAVQDSAHASFLETAVGNAAMVLARCVSCLQWPAYSEDEHALAALRRHWDASVHLLYGTVKRIVAEDEGDAANEPYEDGGSEVLYGRAGFLYALLHLRKVVDEAKDKGYFQLLDEGKRKEMEKITRDSSLRKVVDGIIRRGRVGARRYQKEIEKAPNPKQLIPPLMWRWHGKAYLGGAHGVFGILQMLLSCPKVVVEEYLADISSTVKWVVALQDEEGNWPTKAPSADELRHAKSAGNELVQWCHGAPGAVILLSTILSRSSSPHHLFNLSSDFKSDITNSICRGAELIYKRGLLRKGLGICHGVAGSVYALISASSILDSANETVYLKKAVHLAHLATMAGKFVKDGEMGTPDRPWSLYEGLAGMCCAWSDVLTRIAQNPEKRLRRASGMPGYDDLLLG